MVKSCISLTSAWHGRKFWLAVFAACGLLAWLVASPSFAITAAPTQIANAETACEPLPPPSGPIVAVDSELELWHAVNTATPGTTILIANGTYNLAAQDYYLWIDTPGVTLRSASGNREGVILDDNYQGTETITIAASNVTIADLTLRRAKTHPIHVVSTDSDDTLNTLIYNVYISDPGQQGIKINPHAARIHFTDDGEIACSRIELTDAGRAKVWEFNGSCYTGGVDAHGSQGWVIRDNHIEGFWCEQGLSEHAIHLWTGSRDTLVERNSLVDNARGVGFGLLQSGSGRTYSDDPCPGIAGYIDHYAGVIRNNFVSASRAELFASQAGFDCGICLAQACDARVLHNSVVSTSAPFSSIEWRFANTRAEITNNLLSHNLRARDGANASLAGNLENVPLPYLENVAMGDLHLVQGAIAAIDQGMPVAAGLCEDDFDGDPRPMGAGRDIGADEYGTPPPIAITDLHITSAAVSQDGVTVSLAWTPPAEAVSIALRQYNSLIDTSNWESSVLIDSAIPGSQTTYTTVVSYTGQTVYFALRWQNEEGEWSPVSNPAFWPGFAVHLPLARR